MTMQSPLSSDSASEQEAGPLRRRTIILWLVAIGAAVLLVPLYLVFVTIRNDAARLETRAEVLQQTLQSPSTPVPENQELVNQLAEAEASLEQLNQAISRLEDQNVDWPAVMRAIGNYNPAQLTLSSVETGSSITLRGRAIDDTVVVDYSRGLEDSGLFSRVVVQSLQAMATPFATPTRGTPQATSTPTATVKPTATVTVTPVFEDEYEVDDFRPVPITLGVPQERSFDPLYDVDRVKFLVKAGRYYRIATSDLSPGVDTYVSLDLGGTQYANDDKRPGQYASELVIRGRDEDLEAFVRVSNRGQHGPNMRYELLVEEIVPTPTPTPSITPTPTPTEVPPTPTSDPQDAYEPDDVSPSRIAIGETQLHNFLPEGDVDSVSFLAKAGRWYRVTTSELAQGVDTHLAVTVGGAVYTNDDKEPGDLSSEVVFQVGAEDAQAVVKITNRGQFGELMLYRLSVEELLPTPTPSQTPEPTDTPVPESSPTPDLRDQYEPDDTSPSSISVGETQAHSFYPKDDVDRVRFLAKAGRWYRVSTSGLAEKIDTSLEVTLNLGATTYYTYTNDDRGPGDLSSEVVFDVRGEQDLTAEVEIVNLGQYGPDQDYDVTVEEVYPDLMGVGETQERTFELPVEDLIQFTVKRGATYTVTTSELALGVDTSIAAFVNGELVAKNDDYLTDSYASQVRFEAPEDGRALVTVANLQEQYGPETTYEITVDDATTIGQQPFRVPGLAALVVSRDRSVMLRYAAEGDPWRDRSATGLNAHLDPMDAQAVKFVIVLELAQ